MSRPGSYVSVVGIGHLSRPVYNASLIPIFSPVRCEVAALTRAIVVCKSNMVLPQLGQEIYSVLLNRLRAACKIVNI